MGEQGECFPCFPKLVITVCLNILYLVRTGVDCGACGVLRLLGITDLLVKQNISSKKKAKRSHSLFGGLRLSTQAKK